MPLLSAVIVKADIKHFGWKPKLKGNVKWLLLSLLAPVILTVLGFALFFAIWPDLFSLDGSYLIDSYVSLGMDAEEAEKTVLQTGMSMQMMGLITVIQCVTYVPFLNMFLAIGEEAGWRGFLYPELNKRFGRIPTWLIGGFIWAVFHFPVMLIAGYEYGKDYVGAPVLGLITFTVFCITLGALHEIIYDKTRCIWFPALLHGSINAAITLYRMVLDGSRIVEINRLMVFGPGYNGLISMIPAVVFVIIVAAVVLKGDKKIRA
jgi:membrane protease YdiL (CAAX protease family)